MTEYDVIGLPSEPTAADDERIRQSALRSGVVIKGDTRPYTRRMSEGDTFTGLRLAGFEMACPQPVKSVPPKEPAMLKSWEEMALLGRLKAVHRKGFVLGKVSPAKILVDAADEHKELVDASGTPSELEELCDTILTYFHFAQVRGYTLDQMDHMMLNKLAKRFTIPDEPKATPLAVIMK